MMDQTAKCQHFHVKESNEESVKEKESGNEQAVDREILNLLEPLVLPDDAFGQKTHNVRHLVSWVFRYR